MNGAPLDNTQSAGKARKGLLIFDVNCLIWNEAYHMKRKGRLPLLLCVCLLMLTACAPQPAQPSAPTAPPPVTTPPAPPAATPGPEPSASPDAAPKLSPEEIESIKKAWAYDAQWAMTMPWREVSGDFWHVGLGDAYEATLGVPYEGVDYVCEPAQDLAALSFGTVEHRYFDGFSTTVFTDFYGDRPDEPGYSVTYYISTTQPDCETPRGIHPGNTLTELKEAYPELQKHEGYWTDNNPDYGNATHDSCYVYAPEGTNRSILFLTKEDVIVQIDMVDGLDGQIWDPSGPGVRTCSE